MSIEDLLIDLTRLRLGLDEMSSPLAGDEPVLQKIVVSPQAYHAIRFYLLGDDNLKMKGNGGRFEILGIEVEAGKGFI